VPKQVRQRRRVDRVAHAAGGHQRPGDHDLPYCSSTSNSQSLGVPSSMHRDLSPGCRASLDQRSGARFHDVRTVWYVSC
jgi:hypothetical protein